MKSILYSIVIALFICSCVTNQKPVLRQGNFYTEEQGKEELKKMESIYSNREEWEARKQLLRTSILEGLNLFPLPTRTPLNPVISSRRIYDGYSVENVYFPKGVHDYGYEKRLPVYAFLAKHLGLDLQAVTGPDGTIDESKSELERAENMLVFSSKNPFPANALKGADAIERALKKL